MAATFVDSSGGQWIIKINVAALERIKETAGINLGYIKAAELKTLTEMMETTDASEIDSERMLSLLDKFSETTLGQLSVDPMMQASVLFPIVSLQAEARSITRQQFVELLDGDALARAFDAFWSEYSDFFRQNRQSIFHQVVEACRQFRNVANADIVTETTGPTLPDKSPAKEPAKTVTSGNSSTRRQESSELIPAHSP